MEVFVEQRGAVTLVAVSGSLDALTAPSLAETLAAEASQGHTRLVADFSAVTYASSAGLRAILTGLKAARLAGGDLRLAGVLPRVRNILNLSGFDSLLRLYPDVEAAVASYTA